MRRSIQFIFMQNSWSRKNWIDVKTGVNSTVGDNRNFLQTQFYTENMVQKIKFSDFKQFKLTSSILRTTGIVSWASNLKSCVFFESVYPIETVWRCKNSELPFEIDKAQALQKVWISCLSISCCSAKQTLTSLKMILYKHSNSKNLFKLVKPEIYNSCQYLSSENQILRWKPRFFSDMLSLD